MKHQHLFLVLIFNFLPGQFLFANSDSIDLNNMIEKVSILENKVDILNSANDKFITISWAVIGIMVAISVVLIGLNFWSSFKMSAEKINSFKNEMRSYLEIEMFGSYKEKTTETLKGIISSQISFLKRNDDKMEHSINEIHIQLLQKELEIENYEYGYDIFTKYMSLLNFTNSAEKHLNMAGGYQPTLDTLSLISKYVKENKLSLESKRTLLKNVNKLSDRYKLQIEEITTNIKVSN